jgi:uncharacterized membrane protein YfhO
MQLVALKNGLQQDFKHFIFRINDNLGHSNDFEQTPQSDASMYFKRNDALINLEFDKKNREFVEIKLFDPGVVKYKSLKIIALPIDNKYKNRQKKLINGSPIKIKYNSTGLKAYFSKNHRYYVGSSIPYDRGWHLFINGEEEKIYKVNVGFVGFKLPKGKSDIELRYVNPYILPSIIYFLINAVILQIYFVFKRRIKYK